MNAELPVAMRAHYVLVDKTSERSGSLLAVGPAARPDLKVGDSVKFWWESFPLDINGKSCVVVSDDCVAKES